MSKRLRSYIGKQKTYITDLENYCREHSNFNISNEEAINSVTYGIKCYQINQNKTQKGIIFIAVSNKNSITFANKENQSLLKINLDAIERISFDEQTDNLKDYPDEKKKNKCIQFLSDKKSYDFVFKSSKRLNKIVKGLLLLIEEKKEDFLSDENMENYFDELYRHYDDKVIEYKEVLEYFRSFTSGKEFIYIFSKYLNKNNYLINLLKY